MDLAIIDMGENRGCDDSVSAGPRSTARGAPVHLNLQARVWRLKHSHGGRVIGAWNLLTSSHSNTQ